MTFDLALLLLYNLYTLEHSFCKAGSNSFLTCADTVVRSSSSGVPRVVAGADCFSQGTVGRGQPAIETFPSDSRVSVSPGPSSPWQHTQTLALEQAQNWWALQGGQLRAIREHWN